MCFISMLPPVHAKGVPFCFKHKTLKGIDSDILIFKYVKLITVCFQLRETRRLLIQEEPITGILIRLRFPCGESMVRRFLTSTPMSVSI